MWTRAPPGLAEPYMRQHPAHRVARAAGPSTPANPCPACCGHSLRLSWSANAKAESRGTPSARQGRRGPGRPPSAAQRGSCCTTPPLPGGFEGPWIEWSPRGAAAQILRSAAPAHLRRPTTWTARAGKGMLGRPGWARREPSQDDLPREQAVRLQLRWSAMVLAALDSPAIHAAVKSQPLSQVSALALPDRHSLPSPTRSCPQH